MTPRAATFAVFAVNGAMVGTWVGSIPWKQGDLGVSKSTIGLCLLCMAAGALVAMPLTGLPQTLTLLIASALSVAALGGRAAHAPTPARGR